MALATEEVIILSLILGIKQQESFYKFLSHLLQEYNLRRRLRKFIKLEIYKNILPSFSSKMGSVVHTRSRYETPYLRQGIRKTLLCLLSRRKY